MRRHGSRQRHRLAPVELLVAIAIIANLEHIWLSINPTVEEDM